MKTNGTTFDLCEEPEPSLVVHGDLDFRAASEFAQAAALLIDRFPEVVVDLGRVSFIDSSGIAALLDSRKMASDGGKHVDWRAIPPCVRKALQMSGFAHMFGVEPLRLEVTDSDLPSPSALRRADWQTNESVVVARPVLVASLRNIAVEAAREAGLSETDVGDVKLAVGEALANALKHGHQPGKDKIRLRCMSCASALIVEVMDQGDGFNPDEVLPPDDNELKVGGLGIHLMRSTMDEVEFFFGSDGSRVRMVKWIRDACAPMLR